MAKAHFAFLFLHQRLSLLYGLLCRLGARYRYGFHLHRWILPTFHTVFPLNKVKQKRSWLFDHDLQTSAPETSSRETLSALFLHKVIETENLFGISRKNSDLNRIFESVAHYVNPLKFSGGNNKDLTELCQIHFCHTPYFRKTDPRTPSPQATRLPQQAAFPIQESNTANLFIMLYVFLKIANFRHSHLLPFWDRSPCIMTDPILPYHLDKIRRNRQYAEGRQSTYARLGYGTSW